MDTITPNCYKVLFKQRSGDLVSCVASGYWQYIYPPGMRVEPEYGKLFVFDTFRNAFGFWHENRTTEEVWSAYGENIRPLRKLIRWWYIDTDAAEFWRHYVKTSRIKRMGHLDVAPQGTLICDALTILEKVS